MKELNYLSKEFVAVDEIMQYKIFVNFAPYKERFGWCDCSMSSIETSRSWNYFKFNFEKGKVVTVFKRSNCQLRKIKNGLFKDCYCIIEAQQNDNSFTILYIFGKTKILKYPEMKKFMNEEQVDLLLNQKQIEKMSAEILNSFDITKPVQEYELFFENLPNNVWAKHDFAKNVLKRFDEIGEIKLQTKVDKRFVKLDLCKDFARQYFKTLSQKKEQEKSL